MSDALVILAVTVGLIAACAFFVASEFSLLAARYNRIESAAVTSRSARAALRSAKELSLLLAACQLGITVTTLGLGAVTKPAVHHWLAPLFETSGLPLWLTGSLSFALALLIVTFLHLVIGEMAPKSWAISHPEASAIRLAIPMRAFMALTRPLLHGLNGSANWCLRRVGVEPTNMVVTGRNPDDLRHLVEHSTSVGALDQSFSTQLEASLNLERLTIGDLVQTGRIPTSVPTNALVGQVREATRTSGHLRILICDADAPIGVIHVRDTLEVSPASPALPLARPVFILEADVPVYAALTKMRETRNHLVVVSRGGRMLGVITLADVLRKLFPRTALAA
jgi:CBS domain containing-hemolysin-like protein